MLTEFYTGTAWQWPIPYLDNVLITATYIHGRRSPVDLHGHKYMVDSGVGKEFSSRTKTPRVTLHQYIDVLNLQQPPIAWTLDYPCEPEILKHKGYNASQAQDMTNENTVKLLERFDFVNSVVQGYSVSEYVENLDKLKERGLLTNRLGIGSICRRGQVTEINRVIRAIYNNVPRYVKLHAFGVKLPVLESEAKFYVYSADGFTYPKQWRTGMTKKDKIPLLEKWLERRKYLTTVTEPLMCG